MEKENKQQVTQKMQKLKDNDKKCKKKYNTDGKTQRSLE